MGAATAVAAPTAYVAAYAAPVTPPSDALAKAQAKLSGLGYYKGPVDGEYGPTTARAVEQFQVDNNLPVSGRLDLKTLSSLGIAL